MEQILTHDPVLANNSNVDHLLWFWCFYGLVDDFRNQIKKCSRNILKLTQFNENTPNHTKNIELLQKTKKDHKNLIGRFKICITESSAFYQGLIYRLEALYKKELRNHSSKTNTNNTPQNNHEHRIRCRLITLARCWIYIGDLARYKELHSDRIRKEWTSVRNL